MATKKRRTPIPKSIDRDKLQELIYRHDGLERFTQDSPVLPDVWFEFGKNPTGRIDLLLNPHYEASPGRVAQVIEERLTAEQESTVANRFPCDDSGSSDIAYNQSSVVVRLCFHELIRVVLPLTPWWNTSVWTNDGKQLRQFLSDKKTRQVLARAIDNDIDPMLRMLDPQVIWMMRVIGTIAVAAKGGPKRGVKQSTAIVEACADLVSDIQPAEKRNRGIVWSVTRNREAKVAIWRSTMAVKADAARRLFEISCNHLTWAIIDSGVDARHPAFRVRDASGKPEELAETGPFKSRVTANRTVRRRPFSQRGHASQKP
jgi:serine protease AprX